MKWDDTGIAVCMYHLFVPGLAVETVIGSFYRQAIPVDITQGSPDPSKWGLPVAALDPANCNISQYFVNHSIIFGGFMGFASLSPLLLTSRQISHFVVRFRSLSRFWLRYPLIF